MRHFDLWEVFETGAFADDAEERDEIAAVARQRGSALLGRELEGGEVLVIGDTPLDIRCARAIGAQVVAVATGGYKLHELEPYAPDWLVAGLMCIAPERLVAAPASMRNDKCSQSETETEIIRIRNVKASDSDLNFL